MYTLPVTDDARLLVGVVSLRQLVLSPAEARVEDLMGDELHHVHVTRTRRWPPA